MGTTPGACAVHVVPPLVVLRIVPVSPTAQPVLASMKATEFSARAVPEVCAIQVAPPSVVLTIVQDSPTAHPVSASVKATEQSALVVPGF